MRWFVEITGLGKKPGKGTTLCVEATQWQPALQRARALRGDEGPLSNFSIELLDDGYRAIDPSARLKYVVRRAPEDATLSTGGAASQPPTSGAAEAKTAPSGTPAAAPALEATPALAATEPAVTTATVAAGAKDESEATARPASAVPTTKLSEPVKTRSERPPPPVTVEAKPLIAIPMDKPPPPPAAPGLPRYTVQFQREEDPTARSPLHYREFVYVVGVGTDRREAERLVRDRFVEVKRGLEAARSGKLVNLAVFDHAFEDRPSRPPLVTLRWKDWRGDEPEVLTPHLNGEAPAKPAATTRVVEAPPKTAQAPVTQTPKTVETPRDEPPAAAPAPAATEAKVAVVEPPTRAAPEAPREEPERVSATAAASSVVPSASSSPAISVREATPSTVERVLAAREDDVFVDEAEARISQSEARARDSQPAAASLLPGPKTVVDARIVDAAPGSFPTQSIVPPTPSYVPPVPRQPERSQPPPPAVPTTKRKKRLSADDLISELFEAMSDLHFLGDALAGADYVLGVTLEAIPCELGLVSLFDINKREFVVVRQRGGPRSVLGFRQPEKSPTALAAMRSKAAVLLDEDKAARASDPRYMAIGVELRGLLCAPIALGGRYLGVIELANSTDGEFRIADANALTYVGQQFGEFVAERGVVIDEAHILESAKAVAQAQQGQASKKR